MLSKKSFLILLLISLSGFIASFSAHMISSNLGIILETLGATAFQIGLAVGAVAIAEIIFKTPFGLWADRTGKVKIMVFGLVIFSIASFSYFFINDPALISIVRFLQGIGIAAYSPASIALVADLFRKAKGSAIGTYNTIKGIGYALGPVVGGVIIGLGFGLSSLFVIAGVLGVIIAVLSYVFLINKEQKIDSKKVVSARKAIKQSFGFKFFMGYFIGMSAMFIFYEVISFLGVYARDYNINEIEVGFIISVQSIFYIIFLTLAGRFHDKIGARVLVFVGSILCAAAILLIVFIPSFYSFIIAGILSGIGVGSLWVSSNAFLAEISPRNILGTVMGIDGTFKEVGDAGGPIIIGLLAGIFTLRISFLFSLIFVGLSLFFAFFLKDKHRKNA